MTLLYLARHFVQYGLKPPTIVQMEMEIVALEENPQVVPLAPHPAHLSVNPEQGTC